MDHAELTLGVCAPSGDSPAVTLELCSRSGAPHGTKDVSAPERPFWFDGCPRVGIHTSIAGDPCRALDTAARIGCTALQIFSASPRMWPRPHQRTIAGPVARRFRERRRELRLDPLAIHANYLINPASPDRRQWKNAVEGLRYEIVRAVQLGADYLIVHPGSPRQAGIDRGIENVADAIARATLSVGADPCVRPLCVGHPSLGVRVLIENTAGQGTGLGSRFDHLQKILDACRARGVAPLPGVCLDTAHLLAAGYEICKPEGLERTLDEADATIGLDNIRVIHVNDSKAPLGARRDRHQHIGRGHIGREAFARILNHPRLASPERAFLLETPVDHPGDDRRNVRALWSLLRMTPPIQRLRGGERRTPAVPRPRSRTHRGMRNSAARRAHRITSRRPR